MKKTLLVITIALVVALPNSLYAWGKKGHGIVAEIAFALLDSNAKQAVYKYLGNTTIEGASTWMDEMRSDHRYDYMKPWHYVNIEKGHQYEATKDPNLVNALNTSIDLLKHRDKLSDEDIKKNLMILFHLTGDLHMPLHIGYANDKGGNDVQVRFLSSPSNLHSVWDTDIIEHEGITANDCLALYNRFDKTEVAQFQVVNIEGWINEPRSLLSNVYNVQDGQIDQAYIDRNKPIIKQQLLIAGIRLAAVLTEIFKAQS